MLIAPQHWILISTRSWMKTQTHYVIQALREKIGNDQALVYVVRSNEYYGITKPDFLREVDRFSIWLEEQEEATFVASYTDYLKSKQVG